MHAGRTLVFLADFLDEAAGDEVLKFFVSAQAEHLLAAANGIPYLQVCKNALEKVVEAEYLLLRKDIAKLIGDVVWKAT